jgi:hypothetical protein
MVARAPSDGADRSANPTGQIMSRCRVIPELPLPHSNPRRRARIDVLAPFSSPWRRFSPSPTGWTTKTTAL